MSTLDDFEQAITVPFEKKVLTSKKQRQQRQILVKSAMIHGEPNSQKCKHA